MVLADDNFATHRPQLCAKGPHRLRQFWSRCWAGDAAGPMAPRRWRSSPAVLLGVAMPMTPAQILLGQHGQRGDAWPCVRLRSRRARR